MKTLLLCLVCQLIMSISARAQTVIQGDSSYCGLQVDETDLPTVIAQMGKQYRQKEILNWYTAKLRSGVCISGTRVIGYTLSYKKANTTFYVGRKSNKLEEIHFGSNAPIVSARGIQPGAADFAAVMVKYGAVDVAKKDNSLPRVDVISLDGKTWFTTLHYPGIRFVSLGKRLAEERLERRQVQEIWLE